MDDPVPRFPRTAIAVVVFVVLVILAGVAITLVTPRVSVAPYAASVPTGTYAVGLVLSLAMVFGWVLGASAEEIWRSRDRGWGDLPAAISTRILGGGAVFFVLMGLVLALESAGLGIKS